MECLFSPTILECKKFVTPNTYSSERIIKDYEFDYYIDGDRQLYIDGKYYPIRKGSLVLRTPGQTAYSYGDFNCYILTLDFSGKVLSNYSRHSITPIQPEYPSPIWDIIPPVFIPKNMENYLRIFKELTSISELDLNKNENAMLLVNEFLHLTLADALRNKISISIPEADYIDDICNYMKKHYTEYITLDTLSELTHMNKHYITRKFKERLGIPPISYLIQIRMDNAKRLLIETDITVKNIAENCGYTDPVFFNYYFKKLFGITPVEYRKLYTG